MNFIKTFFASCLGSLVAFVILFFLAIGFLITIASTFGENTKVVVNDNSVLQLKLDLPISENDIENPFEGLPVPGAESSLALLPFLNSLEHAKADPKIKGIYLQVSAFPAGFAMAKEIRDALLDFKTSGKWIIAYGEQFSEKSYYLASVADKVYLHPEGDIEFDGLSVEVSFFKKLFDKLEIRPEVFRVGDFKSAVEPFLLDKMSDENRLQLNEMIRHIHETMLKDIAQSRNLDLDRVKEISNRALITDVQVAHKEMLVDSLYYFDQVQQEMRKRLGIGERDKISFVKYGNYKNSFNSNDYSANEIAVIVADGEIYQGKAEQGTIGSDTFAEELRKARQNDKVKAVVLRINSPGGSALASDVMWREVLLTSQVKPIIASMSDYAASGGYYLAMACDTIVAHPNTITGSIGVFSVLFDLSSFLDEKLGITFDEVKTGDVGELVTFTRPLTDFEKKIWQKKTEKIYETFTTKAATGRGKTVDDIKKIASGRVWTGTQALDNGLVDVLGGFPEAVSIAAKKAGIESDFKLRYYPKQRTFFEEWLMDADDYAETRYLKYKLGDGYSTYKKIQDLRSNSGTQARVPFDLFFK